MVESFMKMCIRDRYKEANAYLLYEFFEKGYNIDHLNIYLRLKEATLRTEDADLIEIVDIFLTKLCQENNREYTSAKDYGDKYSDQNSDELYDIMYDKIMNNLDKYVERIEGTVVHYNRQKELGTISRYDEDGIFFRQEDYVYDEEVQRHDKVEYKMCIRDRAHTIPIFMFFLLSSLMKNWDLPVYYCSVIFFV